MIICVLGMIGFSSQKKPSGTNTLKEHDLSFLIQDGLLDGSTRKFITERESDGNLTSNNQ